MGMGVRRGYYYCGKEGDKLGEGWEGGVDTWTRIGCESYQQGELYGDDE
jgi:hypothetical protein